jgi:glutamate 5-kinase
MGIPGTGTSQERESVASAIRAANRIVVKIGTSSLVKDDKTFDLETIKKLAFDIEALKKRGKEVLLVTSGAVTAGIEAMKITERPREVVALQVLAAVGQPLLMGVYSRFFSEYRVAQILLTQRDLSDRQSFNHFREALEQMLRMGIVPIINENDTVSIDELTHPEGLEFNFSDNDVLSALVAASIKAELLVILSDTDGLYDKNPSYEGAQLIPFINKITPEIRNVAEGGGKLGRGGMGAKLLAADIVTNAGAAVIIANAKKTRLVDIIDKTNVGTVFQPQEELPDKKLWMLFSTILAGKLIVDDGARDAIINGASLLFAGIVKIAGHFHKKDIVEIMDKNGDRFARGIINYSSDELSRILKMPLDVRKEYLRMGQIKDIISRYNMAIL